MATGIGVDFSPRYQKDTPIPAGTEYAWIKLADGAGPYRLVAPDAMVARFKARRIPIGGYSYAQPGDGAAHARVLIAECRRLGALDLVPVIDIESDPKIHTWSTAEATAYGRAFCREVIAQGLRPGVYMNDSLAGACRPDLWPENPVLWIARYGAKPRQIPRYDVHQFSSSPIDQNQSYTNRHFLTAAGGGSTPAGPSTQEVPEMTRYECRAALGVNEDEGVNDPGYVQVEPSGRADSFIRVMPGDMWIVDVAASEGVEEQGHFELAPVFIEHLYHYGVNGEGMGNDPGAQDAVKTVNQKVETIPTPNVARTGVRYSSNAPFVIITG